MSKQNFGAMVTLGTDYDLKYSWTLQMIDDVPCIVLYKRQNDGFFRSTEEDVVAVKPIMPILKTVEENINRL